MKTEPLEKTLEQLRNALERNDLAGARTIIDSLLPADQADLVEGLETSDQVALLTTLKPADSADLLEEMEDQEAAAVAELLPADQLAVILDKMEDDEAADILGDLPTEKAAETLQEMKAPKEVIPLLRYPDDTAGGLMTRSVITLRPEWTVDKALAELRRLGPKSNSTYYLFITDKQDMLLGVIGLRELATAPAGTTVGERMNTEIVSVLVTTDQEECALVLSRHGYLALPVVDEIGRFLGVITADDLIEVTEDEATEDMYRMVGITGEEQVFGPAGESVVKRLPWLAINMITLFVAITVVDFFEPVIASLVALAVFLPLVSGEGGNAGSQTTTVIVRGTALGEVSPGDSMRALDKELRVALVNGLLIGFGTAVVVLIWEGDWRISAAIWLAMVLNFLMGAVTGVMIPLGLKKANVDPALASAAFVTGFTDTFGFLFFLGLSALFVNLFPV